MNKFENAKIYKIVDNTTDMIYIGSTCKTLEQRLKAHESNYKRFKAGKMNYITSFKIFENNNYKIELIKLYPCDTKQELNLEEGKTIKQFKNNKLNIVNKYIAGQTDKESMAQNYQNNKNLIHEKHNCLCGGRYTQCHKSHHEKTQKHQNYINNSKTLINKGDINITINITNPEDLNKLDLLNIVK